jgi:hypothetical protein
MARNGEKRQSIKYFFSLAMAREKKYFIAQTPSSTTPLPVPLGLF